MHFAQPLLGLLALLAVPIILLMYLLKQKYKEKQVPSLYLWEKVLTQTKAQEPWQKLRKNLLMFLQIAAALLLARSLSHGKNTGAGLYHWFGLLFEYAGNRRRKKPF